MAEKKKLTEQLRDVVRESGMSNYKLWKESGISQAVLGRFMKGQEMNSANLDLLGDVLDLEIKPRKKQTRKD